MNRQQAHLEVESTSSIILEVASRLIRDVGYEPVLIGRLEMGKHLMPGKALAGGRSAEEIRKIAGGIEVGAQAPPVSFPIARTHCVCNGV